MKPLLISAVALLLLSSCEKKQCWQCTTTTYYPAGAQFPPQKSTKEVCDMTDNDKETYELVNSTTWTTKQNEKEIETATVTTCQ
jgi:hypothetical protein